MKDEKNYPNYAPWIVALQKEMICVFLPCTTLQFANPALRKFFSIAQEDIGRKTFLDLVPKQKHQCVESQIRKVIRKKTVVSSEHQTITREGLCWVRWTYYPLINSHGEVTQVIGVGTDFSNGNQQQPPRALREAESKFTISEKRYRAIVESHTDLFASVDLQNKFTFANKACCMAFGVEREDIIGRDYTDFLHPDDIEYTLDKVSELQHKKRVRFEHRVRTVDGWRWVNWEDTAIWDESGETIEVQGVGRDVTEVVELREALDREKRNLHAILEGTNAVTYLWNVQTDVIYYNDKFYEITGYTHEEVKPFTVGELDKIIHPDDLSKCRKLTDKHFEGKIARITCEYRIRHRNGSWIWVAERGRVYEWTKDGQPLIMAGTLLDISQRKQAQLALQHQSQFEKLVAEISSDFIEVSSKDINGKINTMLEKVGKFFEVDRARLFLFDKGTRSMSNTHEWCAEGVEPQKMYYQRKKLVEVPWWKKQLMSRKVVIIYDTSKMPSEAKTFQQHILKQKIKSLITINVGSEESLTGVLGFDSVKGKRRWSENDISLLKVLADVLLKARYTINALMERKTLLQEIKGTFSFENIVSKSNVIQDLFEILPAVAESESNILIEGESGTGKELFARAIHNRSPRAGRPFVKVNCGALPDNLLESELFGHRAGAFTDAKKDKPGRFTLADGGTIFLDEIGDISPPLQVKLLQVLQDGTYEPLGSLETMKSNVRLVAATNKNMDELVGNQEFRDDLFYRINVMRIVLPPLRKRKEDIPLLIEHFIDKYNNLKGKNISGVHSNVLAAFMTYDYPGNVRELENIIEHCFILCTDRLILNKHLPSYVRAGKGKETDGLTSEPKTIKQMEYYMIRAALERSGGNRAAAARELGISRRSLFYKLKSYEIDET